MKKHLSFDLKDDNDKGEIAFYFSKFDVKDSDKDIVQKGAFKRTSQNIKRIKHAYNHNIYQIPGVIKSIQEDDKGAFAVSQLALKTKLGNDVYEQYKAGIITEHSYGFDIIKTEKDEDKEATLIKEIKLYEVSSLTAWGANEHTNVIDIKSMDYLEMLLKMDKYDDKIVIKIKEVLNYLQSLEHTDEVNKPIDTIKYLQDNLNFIQ